MCHYIVFVDVIQIPSTLHWLSLHCILHDLDSVVAVISNALLACCWYKWRLSTILHTHHASICVRRVLPCRRCGSPRASATASNASLSFSLDLLGGLLYVVPGACQSSCPSVRAIARISQVLSLAQPKHCSRTHALNLLHTCAPAPSLFALRGPTTMLSAIQYETIRTLQSSPPPCSSR